MEGVSEITPPFQGFINYLFTRRKMELFFFKSFLIRRKRESFFSKIFFFYYIFFLYQRVPKHTIILMREHPLKILCSSQDTRDNLPTELTGNKAVTGIYFLTRALLPSLNLWLGVE